MKKIIFILTCLSTLIAHMLSGTTLTDAAINNAKELLNQSYRK